MMKKTIFLAGLLAMSLGFTACSDDEEGKVIPEGTADVNITDNNLDVTAANVEAWGKYAGAVSTLLAQDASALSDAWLVDYEGTWTEVQAH